MVQVVIHLKSDDDGDDGGDGDVKEDADVDDNGPLYCSLLPTAG